jgi:hypothetical protein
MTELRFKTLLKSLPRVRKEVKIARRSSRQPSTDARYRAEGTAHLRIYLFQFSEVWTFELSPGI